MRRLDLQLSEKQAELPLAAAQLLTLPARHPVSTRERQRDADF